MSKKVLGCVAVWLLGGSTAWTQQASEPGSWTTGLLVVGTATDIPVGVAVRAFGPTGDVVFVTERRDGPNSPATQHFLNLHRMTCAGDCAIPGAWPTRAVLGSLGNDQFYQPSLALRGEVVVRPLAPVPVTRVVSAHIVRRTGPTGGCGPRLLNLSEEEFNFDTSAWTHRDIDSNGAGGPCLDRQLSFAQTAASAVWACFTLDPTAAVQDNETWCGTRPLGSASWSINAVATGADDQDHPWFVHDGVQRYLVHRNRDASPDAVRLQVPEAGVAGDLPGALKLHDRDYPSIARDAHGFYAVWHEPKLVGGEIRFSSCPSTSDCTLATSWSPSVLVRQAPGAKHAEIAATDGQWMASWIEPDEDGFDRVHYQSVCGGGAWPGGPGEVPRPAAGLPVHQSTFIGRPHLAVDETHRLVHLAFVEWNNTGNPTDSDVYWARKVYALCR